VAGVVDASESVESAAGVRADVPPAVSVGVVVWLASELMFFSGLFAAYFSLRASTSPWPPAGVELATLRTGVATVALVLSSLTMHFAVRAGERDDRTATIRWLSLTSGLALLFLANLAWEYVEAPFRISSHAYGSMFFIMTGFHGLHVIGGVLFMAAVIGMIAGPGSRAPVGTTVRVCGYYWHFVDVVWLAMFVTIYLIR
jgi:cytochrome c oxidase subunit 3